MPRNTLYPRLEDHESVLNYPDVRGMGKNVFFLRVAPRLTLFDDGDAEDVATIAIESPELQMTVPANRMLSK